MSHLSQDLRQQSHRQSDHHQHHNDRMSRYRSLQPLSYHLSWKEIKDRLVAHDFMHRFNETLHRSESMVSLCFRSLVKFVNEDDLPGLQAFLENKQVQVDDRDENGTTPLMVAAVKGRVGFVRELLSHGADANAEDSDGWTALLCASKEGHADICHELLEHGADIDHREIGGWTALMWATYKDRLDVLVILLDRGADVNAHGNYHISSLLWAAGRGYSDIAKSLIQHGAKVNVGDKYGTTALVWACRKGHTEIVDCLLKAGANVDTAGMYSWTALLVATQGNHVDVVNLLLEHKPNVNALDKDGCTALTIACKEGFYEIACALLGVGAYINIQDRAGDTNLIHAVKGGHRAVVEALLKKYADVDISGKDRKTAIYNAVEKANAPIVKLLLNANPDLEISTKDGDTPLLKAVRARNAELVSLLLEKKAKVTATDKKGDSSLHIAMRARSKAIVEILLRNPKNSQLLYRPNRAGETPYNIDINHQKTILGQIFGARRLNTNEDNENMLGYDLYSSALADILSEPSLSMPITVGLYAKWGSGKSFLLNKLREEMKNFARDWVDPVFQFSSLLFIVVIHFALIIGMIVGVAVPSWILGLSIGLGVFVLIYTSLILVWFASQRYDWDWPYNFNRKLTRNLNTLKLILQVMFCHPPGIASHETLAAQPIKFYFTDQTRVSTTTGGENSVVQMIGSLYDAIETDYGSLPTRLYRAFKPKPAKSSSTWRWRKLCCLPYVLIFEIMFLCLLVGICALTVFLVNHHTFSEPESVEKITIQVVLATVTLLLGVCAVANIYTWSKMFKSLLFSQRRHLQRTIAKLDTLKSEGFLQALKHEVNLMKDMVRCLDSLSGQQRRLVIILDGLDSCEQDKVLLVLDAVHMLFSDANCPFIVILAIDPHVIAKAVEVSSRRLFSDTNIGGHDYLRNMVHLPFYLQNSGLRKVKIAQQTAQAHRKINSASWNDAEDSYNMGGSTMLGRSLSNRRLSSESALMSSSEKLKLPPRKGSRKLKLSESVASSIGSNLNRIGGAQDLTKMLLTDDYFSDVNPRSMRRLMNVVYVTGRLLKSFQIDFNWYHLASWINITEQWPFRTSWIILHHEIFEDNLDDNTSLKSLYDKVRPHIPTLKDIEPLLELDRDERKFDIFLTFHRSSLLVSDLKIFLPFTINLDPYLKKVIKEEAQSLEEDGLPMGMGMTRNPVNTPMTPAGGWMPQTDWATSQKMGLTRRQRILQRNAGAGTSPQMMFPQTPQGMRWPQPWAEPMHVMTPTHHYANPYGLAPVTQLPPDILETKLSAMSVEGVCQLLRKIDDLNSQTCQNYITVVKDNNINGKVLLHCDLDELKTVLKMNFGDWEMFRVLIVSMREHELTTVCKQDEARNVRFQVPYQQKQNGIGERKGSVSKTNAQVEKDINKMQVDGGSSTSRAPSKHSVMEKQVTLEEQMICGALQTLNEEACEDVEAEHAQEVPEPTIIPATPADGQDVHEGRSRTNSSCGVGEMDYVILQSSPINHLHWAPVSIAVEGQSEHSSQCSTPAALSPVLETRKASNLKANSNYDSDDKNSSRKNSCKHVVIKAEYSNSEEDNNKIPNTPSDMKSLFDHVKYTFRTPLMQPSSTENLADSKQKKTSRSRPSSLHIFKDNQTALKDATRIKSKSTENTVKNPADTFKTKVKDTAVDKVVVKRKDKIAELSDDESTPLVSDLSSTPSAGSSQYVTGFSHNSSKSEPISSPSSIGSVTSQSSMSPDSKRVISSSRSNQNITESTNLNQSTDFSDSQNGLKALSSVGGNMQSLSPDFLSAEAKPRRRTMSDVSSVSMSKVLDPASHIYQLVTVSSSSLASKGSSLTGHGKTASLSSSGHLSRQDALDSDEENMKYLFCNSESGV